MKVTLRGFVCPLLAAGLGVVLAAGPAAPLAVLPSFGAPAMAESGYTLMGLSSPGFFRGAGDGIQGMVTAFGIAAYAECAAAAVFIALSAAGLFSPRLSRAAFGLVYSSAVAGMSARDPSWEGAYTLAYIPWIVGAAVLLARAAAMQWLPASSKRTARKAAEAELARVAQLERYAALYKQGLLNDEEFSAAKAKLLP